MAEGPIYEETVLPRRWEMVLWAALAMALWTMLGGAGLGLAFSMPKEGGWADLSRYLIIAAFCSPIPFVATILLVPQTSGFHVGIDSRSVRVRHRLWWRGRRWPVERVRSARKAQIRRSIQQSIIMSEWEGLEGQRGRLGQPSPRPRHEFVAATGAPRHVGGPATASSEGVLLVLDDGTTVGFETAHPDEALRVLREAGVGAG